MKCYLWKLLRISCLLLLITACENDLIEDLQPASMDAEPLALLAEETAESRSGSSTPAWASHHNMTAAKYQEKFNGYKSKGYRLIMVDGYRVGNKLRYAALWEKSSGPAYKAHHGLTSSQYQNKFNTYKAQGYRLKMVDGAGGTSAKYAAIWEKKSGPAYKTHHGMTAASYQSKFNDYKSKGYRLVLVNAYGVGNKGRYAAIWEKKSGPAYKAHHGMSSASYQQKVNTYLAQGYRIKMVSGYNIGNTDYYAAIWEKKGGAAWSARHRMSSLGYQNEFDNHRFSGYKLIQVSGYARNGKAQFAAVWESTGVWKSADRKHIDNTVAAFMQKHQVPGVSIALIKDERLVFAKGYGKMNKNTGTAVGPTSLFRVASVSKPITSVAMMKLRESNPSLLNKKVFGNGALLGNNYGANSYSNREKQIRVQHLLEHTAGGNQWNNKWDGNAGPPMFQQLGFNHSQLIGWVLDNRNPEKTPGAKNDYSNFGYCVAGRVIEAKTGQTYENYVRNSIFKPMGINRLYVAGDKASERRYNEVTYYGDSPYTMKVKRMDAHGGWLGSSIDLARFLVHTDGKTNKPDVISTSSYNTMVTPSAANSGYAKGWSITGSNEWHNGSFDGGGAIIVQAGNGLSWVLLMNKRWESDADGMMWDIVNGINNWPSHDWF